MHKPRSISLSHPSRLSSSPAGTKPEARASDPVALPSAAATGTAEPSPHGSGPEFRRVQCGLSCSRTEDGTVIVFDRRTGRAVSPGRGNRRRRAAPHLPAGILSP